MVDRIHVFVCATDPLSEAGLTSAMRTRSEVRLVTADEVTREAVAVIAAEAVDEAAVALVQRVHILGVRRVAIVADHLDDAGLMTAAKAGVSALIRRQEATPDRLVQVTQAVSAGRGDVPADLVGRLLDQVCDLQAQGPAPHGQGFRGLTEREVEVLRLVAQGLDTHEIAARLSYSERTVKNTLHDMTNRFHLRNRSHAVAFAMQEGLI